MAEAQRPDMMREVAACTIAAAHRRDHQHDVAAHDCHPHAVEVVHLGHRAVMVCHDCHSDTGFVANREAEQIARNHRQQTRADLPTAPSAGTTPRAA